MPCRYSQNLYMYFKVELYNNLLSLCFIVVTYKINQKRLLSNRHVFVGK